LAMKIFNFFFICQKMSLRRIRKNIWKCDEQSA
jgi:ribosomal protein L37AE/L43A